MSIPDAEVGCLTIHSEALQKNTNKQLRQFVKETGAEAEDYTTRTELLEFAAWFFNEDFKENNHYN